MRVGIVGVNHKSADLHLRDLLAKACQKRFSPGGYAHGEHAFVLLSTCNRTEVYFSSEDLAETHSYLLRILRYDVTEEFEHKLYSYFGYDCFTHLCRVTVGMDSAILAETEIQGQVKNAYEAAALLGRLPRDLHYMFQKCLKIGKEIRTLFPSPRGMPSIEDGIFEVGASIFPNFQTKKILFVGVSDINCKILMKMKAAGFENIALCNRTDRKAKKLAILESILFVPWHELSTWHEFDVVMFATKSPEYLICKEDIPIGFLSKKVVIDLSVPRNVDPQLGSHPDVTLLNIDQINQHVDQVRLLKKIEMERIETLVNDRTEKQLAVFHSKEKIREELFAESKMAVLGF
jgi:glutamyl-tRNA reductase